LLHEAKVAMPATTIKMTYKSKKPQKPSITRNFIEIWVLGWELQIRKNGGTIDRFHPAKFSFRQEKLVEKAKKCNFARLKSPVGATHQ